MAQGAAVQTKIGIFDSGIGGMTVLAELRKSFGDEVQYVYLGDTAHVPYGTKSPAQIERFSVQCAEILKAKNVDLMVVACNTASSWALPAIRRVMEDVPVIGVVEPGANAALQAFSDLDFQGAILVLATRATVQSGAYGKAINRSLGLISGPLGESRNADGSLRIQTKVQVHEQACPLLVPMIEEGWIDHQVLYDTIAEYVAPYRQQHSGGVALLGCTHYPWIHSAFVRALPGWTVVNSASSVARSLGESFLLQQMRSQAGLGSRKMPEVEWIFTDPESVPLFARQWIDASEKRDRISLVSGMAPCDFR